MANTVEPTYYAFTNTGVFSSWDGGNTYVINTSIGAVNTSYFTGTFTILSANAMTTGHIYPANNGGCTLGNSSLRWGVLYVSDMSLNNGIGDWTIVEGVDDLFLYNNTRNKVYKFNLTEVDQSEAVPKRLMRLIE